MLKFVVTVILVPTSHSLRSGELPQTFPQLCYNFVLLRLFSTFTLSHQTITDNTSHKSWPQITCNSNLVLFDSSQLDIVIFIYNIHDDISFVQEAYMLNRTKTVCLLLNTPLTNKLHDKPLTSAVKKGIDERIIILLSMALAWGFSDHLKINKRKYR